MPVSGGKYVAPVWQNGGPPALDADELNAISQSIVRNQGDIAETQEKAKGLILPPKIASYETAGAYTWTAPDLNNGKPYKIGVMIIGAGGSGAASMNSSSYTSYGPGGASGFSTMVSRIVTPGEIINVVVGSGGLSFTAAGAKNGNNGGTSSFGYDTANGGEGGKYCCSNHAITSYIAYGAQPTAGEATPLFGPELQQSIYNMKVYSKPFQCFNFFENIPILGGGGLCSRTKSGAATYGLGAKNADGNGGGDGGNPAGAGNLPGCGGGGSDYAGTPGAGADGAVYIYLLGVAA